MGEMCPFQLSVLLSNLHECISIHRPFGTDKEGRMVVASKEEIAAAKAYNELHVPALFRQWAPLVVEAACIQPGQRVLDVACGTGVLTQHIASAVGKHGFVAGLDAGRGMLAVARELSPSIEWQEGIAESLPYDDISFDAVVSQFGLMFFHDRRAALQEMLRILVPGGWMAVAVWESLENSEAYPVVVGLLERLAGDEAADALRAPFVLGNRDELSALFRDAGVESVTVTTHHGTAKFPTIRTMVEADLRGWLPLMGVNLKEDLIQTILRESEKSLAEYVKSDGTVEFDAPAHIVCGRRSDAKA
jgi:ubiquinone/menaquinone biosynthesis C-methylase UbiE